MYTGPHIIKDGLVFGYDTGYGIADNDTATRFYSGKPTDNLNADPYHSTRSAGDTINLSKWGGDTGQGSFEVNTSPPGGGMMFINHNTSNPAGSGGTYTDFPSTRYTLTNGVTYTRSWWAKADDVRSASGHICSCNRDSTNTYIVGGSVSLTTEWQRYTHTFTYTGPTSNDWQFRHIIYDASKVYIANVQLEVSSVASPFVSGTRSDTASLIDLKETTDINVSNVSFDSTGQPTFDGSNDYISIDVDSWIRSVNSVTVEGVVIIPSGASLSGGPWSILTDHSTASAKDGFWWHMSLGGGYTYFRVEDDVSGEQGITFSGATPFASGNTYHIVTIVGLNSVKIYVNGVLSKSYTPTFNWANVSASHTASLFIGRTYPNYWLNSTNPVVRVYDVALTEAEIKQNYNAYKNRFDI